MCTGLPYNTTIIPNLMGHQDQTEAMAELHPYSPLTKIQCSKDIQLFLCSMYAPPCIGEWDKPLKPCRDLCESARVGCESLMKKFGYDWPKTFECSNFPAYGGAELCMVSSATENSQIKNQAHANNIEEKKDLVCPRQFSAQEEKSYNLHFNKRTIKNCGAPCFDMFYHKPQIKFIHTWNSVVSWIGLMSVLFNVATFLIEPKRFNYPQRIIIHMSICYGIVELLYIIGFHSGADLPIGKSIF